MVALDFDASIDGSDADLDATPRAAPGPVKSMLLDDGSSSRRAREFVQKVDLWQKFPESVTGEAHRAAAAAPGHGRKEKVVVVTRGGGKGEEEQRTTTGTEICATSS